MTRGLRVRFLPILLLSVVAFVLLSTFVSRHSSGHAVGANAVVTGRDAKLKLSIAVTGLTWHEKPVYVVQNNTGRTLEHLTLESWSHDLLPVLETGKEQSMRGIGNALPGPFSLSSGQRLWFVGPTEPPLKIILHWLDRGQPRFEILPVGGTGA